MTAADEYQRVLTEHRLGSDDYTRCACGSATANLVGLRAHVARALAADPGVRAAVEREALERAKEAIKAERLSIPKQVQVVMGLVRAERIVRDLTPRKDGERESKRFLMTEPYDGHPDTEVCPGCPHRKDGE